MIHRRRLLLISETSVTPPESEKFFVYWYDYQGGKLLKREEVVYGGSATPPETKPERDGYRFIGWGDSKLWENITQDTYIYAQWKEDSIYPDNYPEKSWIILFDNIEHYMTEHQNSALIREDFTDRNILFPTYVSMRAIEDDNYRLANFNSVRNVTRNSGLYDDEYVLWSRWNCVPIFILDAPDGYSDGYLCVSPLIEQDDSLMSNYQNNTKTYYRLPPRNVQKWEKKDNEEDAAYYGRLKEVYQEQAQKFDSDYGFEWDNRFACFKQVKYSSETTEILYLWGYQPMKNHERLNCLVILWKDAYQTINFKADFGMMTKSNDNEIKELNGNNGWDKDITSVTITKMPYPHVDNCYSLQTRLYCENEVTNREDLEKENYLQQFRPYMVPNIARLSVMNLRYKFFMNVDNISNTIYNELTSIAHDDKFFTLNFHYSLTGDKELDDSIYDILSKTIPVESNDEFVNGIIDDVINNHNKTTDLTFDTFKRYRDFVEAYDESYENRILKPLIHSFFDDNKEILDRSLYSLINYRNNDGIIPHLNEVGGYPKETIVGLSRMIVDANDEVGYPYCGNITFFVNINTIQDGYISDVFEYIADKLKSSTPNIVDYREQEFGDDCINPFELELEKNNSLVELGTRNYISLLSRKIIIMQ